MIDINAINNKLEEKLSPRERIAFSEPQIFGVFPKGWLLFNKCEDDRKITEKLYARDNGIAQIDKFIEAMNLEIFLDSKKCVLTLHSFYCKLFEKEALKIKNVRPRISRYRGFLLVFNKNIPKDFFYVSLIIDEIGRIENLKSFDKDNYTFNDHRLLKYLQHNQFIY